MAENCSISELLSEADLLCYELSMRTVLRLRCASDICYVDEKDLLEIGMSRPEQKRLKAIYHKKFPKGSIMGKLKRKILGKSDASKSDRNSVSNNYDQHVIPIDKITLSRQLGKGEFGAVFQAAWNNSNNENEQIQVAVKCISPEKLLANPINFLQEAAIMHKMRHDCVVRLYGVVFDTKAVMLVSELAACGSLLECLQKPSLRDSFMVDVLCDFCSQIARGMEYLSNERLIHRDLAARNVLVFAPDKVKISDFGLSRSLGMGEDYYRSEFKENMKLPIAWCAPESINFLKFTSASDVWSYGVTLFEIFSYGEMPWRGFTGAKILSLIDYPCLQHLKRPDHCPMDFYRMMLQCWAYKPEERPCFSDIVEMLSEIMPQTLITVTSCRDGVCDHLQYDKNEVIFVLDKCPSAYPDGYFWQGNMKNGRLGLFRPDETVAKLAVDMPSIKHEHASGGAAVHKTAKIQSGEKEKERRSMMKLLISEPQGDVRHTCHVGADGTTFGLLQFNKNEIGLSEGIISCHRISPTLPLGSAPPPSPPQISASTTSFSESESIRSELKSPPLFPKAVIPPSLPATAPKPGKYCARPVEAIHIFDNFKAIPTTSDTITTLLSDVSTDADSISSDDRLLISISRSKCNQPIDDRAIYVASDVPNSNMNAFKMDNNGNELISDDIMSTDFYLRSESDISDRKPLLMRPKIDVPKKPVTNAQPVMRFMSETELEKLNGKVIKEHKKVDRKLDYERRKEDFTWRRVFERENSETDADFKSSARMATNTPDEWNEEAQRAYKLLVQCGEHLQSAVTDVVPEQTTDRTNRYNELSNGFDAHVKSNVSSAATKSSRVKFAEDSSAKDANASRNTSSKTENNFPKKRIPPPVPPKPRMWCGMDNIGVSLSEIIEVRGGPLHDEELLALIIIGCEVLAKTSVGVFSPDQFILHTDGVLQIKTVSADDVSSHYVPPEMLEGNTDVDAGAVHVFCLGEVLRFAGAAESGNADLFSLLNVMTVAHVATRPSITRLAQMAKNKLEIQNPKALLAEMYTLVMGDEADDFEDLDMSSGEYVLNAIDENGELKNQDWLSSVGIETNRIDHHINGQKSDIAGSCASKSDDEKNYFVEDGDNFSESPQAKQSVDDSPENMDIEFTSNFDDAPTAGADQRKEKQRRMLIDTKDMLSGTTVSDQREDEERPPRKKPTTWNDIEEMHVGFFDYGDDIVEYKGESEEVKDYANNENSKPEPPVAYENQHDVIKAKGLRTADKQLISAEVFLERNTSHSSLSPISESNEALDKIDDSRIAFENSNELEGQCDTADPKEDGFLENRDLASPNINMDRDNSINIAVSPQQDNTSPDSSQTFSRKNSLLPNRISGRKPSTRHGRRKSKAEPEFVSNLSSSAIRLKAPAMRKKKMTLHRVEHTDVTVELLNGKHVEVSCRSDAIAAEIADVVMRHMNFNENSFFGLTVVRSGEHFFLDDHQRLEKFAPPGWKSSRQSAVKRIFKLYLRFRYYPASISFIKTDVVLHELYLQLRRDLLDDRLQPKREIFLELAALALQAEYADKPSFGLCDYFSLQHYVTKNYLESYDEEEIRNAIVNLHGKHKGLKSQEAEINFLVLCQRLPDYGAHIHRVFTSKPSTNLGNTPFGDPETGVAQWVGILSRGILQFEEQSGYRLAVVEHLWQNTKTLQFDKKRFVIVSEVHEPSRTVFFTDHYSKSAYFVRFAASQHRFMIKMRQWNQTLRQNSPFQAHKIPDVAADLDFNAPGTSSIDFTPPVSSPVQSSIDASENKDSKRNGSIDSVLSNESVSSQNGHLSSVEKSFAGDKDHEDTAVDEVIDNGDGYTLEVDLIKDPNAGLGLTLVDGNLNGIKGVYVKSVSDGGVGKAGGIVVGDRLIRVNDVSLVGKDRHATVDLVRRSEKVVSLKLFRLEAISSALTTKEKVKDSIEDQQLKAKLSHSSLPQETASAVTRSKTPPPPRKKTNHPKKRVRAVSDFGAIGDTLPELNSEDLLMNLREDSKLRFPQLPKTSNYEDSGHGYDLSVSSIYKFDGVEEDIDQTPKSFTLGGMPFSSPYNAGDIDWPKNLNGSIRAQNDATNEGNINHSLRSQPNLDWTDDLNDISDSTASNLNFVTLERNEMGSLGFQIASSGGFVYVKQITAEPALSCPSIKMGDRISSVNGELIYSLTHQQVVDLLRNGGKVVTLGLNKSDGSPLFVHEDSNEETVCVLLEKSHTGSLGLSLAKKTGYDGIYIRMISSGSAADCDGTLKVGDKIWKVNGHLVNNCTPGAIVDMLKAASSPVEIVIKRVPAK